MVSKHDDIDYLVTRRGRYSRPSLVRVHSTAENEPVNESTSSKLPAVVAQVFETYELVGDILLHLSRKDIAACMLVTAYIKSVVERSHRVCNHLFGPFPARHTTLWTKGLTGPVTCLPGPMLMRSATARRKFEQHRRPEIVIPVALSEAIHDLGQVAKFQREPAARNFPRANVTNDEALALIMHRLIQYPEMHFVASLNKAVPRILDMTFTIPPVSHIAMAIGKSDGSRRSCSVRCTAGIRVRHVVAAVSEWCGDSWVEQLWVSGMEHKVMDKKAVVVSKEMMDLAARKGTVRYPVRRLRRRNYENTDGEKVQIPESDWDSEDSDM